MLKLVSVICSLTDPNKHVNQALVNNQIINHKSVPIFWWDGNPPSRS